MSTATAFPAEVLRGLECETRLQDAVSQPDARSIPETHVVKGLTLSDARDLLDWLEAHGITHFEVDLDDKDMICVTWTD